MPYKALMISIIRKIKETLKKKQDSQIHEIILIQAKRQMLTIYQVFM